MRDASDLRILLWDIDGTLIRSIKTGGYKDYTIPVLEEVFGTSGRLSTMRVSGMTDLQIVAEALRDEGITHEEIREKIHHLCEKLTAEAAKLAAQLANPQFAERAPAEKVAEVNARIADIAQRTAQLEQSIANLN